MTTHTIDCTPTVQGFKHMRRIFQETITRRTGGPAMNQYSSKPYAASKTPFFVYNVEDQCDSGD